MTEETFQTVPNQIVLALVQALLGQISPNFRMVTIASDGETVKLQFVLHTESVADREAIEDIASEFETFQESSVSYKIETDITTGQISWPQTPVRVVYRRREE